MKKKETKTSQIAQFLSDDSIPLEKRKEALQMTLLEGSPESTLLIGELLEGLEYRRSCAVYKQLMKDLKSGPLRGGVYISSTTDEESGINTAEVRLEDGQTVYSVMPEEISPDSLKKGDRILLDGRGQAILRKVNHPLRVGDEAIFERTLDNGRVEVTIRDQERCVYLVTHDLEMKIAAGEVNPGDTFIINPRQQIAMDVIPSSKEKNRYQFLSNEPVPNVVAARDIGNPSPVIADLAKHLTIEMTNPDIRRLYRLPRSTMHMFLGIPGSGKTMAINATWRNMYQIMSELTGVPIEELPPRVFRLQSSTVLSEWFGKSEKLIERFFDEIIQLSRQKWTAPDGREHELPVLCIVEEVDGIARARGSNDVYDRVITTLLQRLDPNREDLKDRLILFIGTSNTGDRIDSAFMRRLGSNIEKFTRLDRQGFSMVLRKQISELPIAHSRPDTAHESVVADITSWLFSRNGSDPGVVELTYAGSTTPDLRYRRDFLTGALVNRAVLQAATRASNDAYDGLNGSGIHLEHLVAAFDQQILSAADQISLHNAVNIVEVPDGARVANIRRLPQPGQFPLQLQSN